MEIDLTKEYVVIDIETTGKKACDGKIIEIALVKIKDGKPCDYFHSLINPEVKIHWYVSRLTGIKTHMLKGSPTFREIAHKIIDFIGNSIIVAHNASFDCAFLKSELERAVAGYCFTNEKICTVKLARKKFPHLGKYNLDFLSQTFNIHNPHRHRAYGDAMATTELFLKYLVS